METPDRKVITMYAQDKLDAPRSESARRPWILRREYQINYSGASLTILLFFFFFFRRGGDILPGHVEGGLPPLPRRHDEPQPRVLGHVAVQVLRLPEAKVGEPRRRLQDGAVQPGFLPRALVRRRGIQDLHIQET